MYYLGFLKKNTKDAVIFKAMVKPKQGDYRYFVKVMGPYATENEARIGLLNLKRIYGYKENPSQETLKASRANIKYAMVLTKKVMKLYKEMRKINPGKEYHDRKFLAYLRELEKYMLGSVPYISTLAKAYEHLASARDSIEERAR